MFINKLANAFAIFLCFLVLFGCNQPQSNKENVIKPNNIYFARKGIRKKGNIIYQIKNAPSIISVFHEECTECLDATIDTGLLNIPLNLKDKIYNNGKPKYLTYVDQLYLVDSNGKEISTKLFGDYKSSIIDSPTIIYGNVIGIKDGAFLFSVNRFYHN